MPRFVTTDIRVLPLVRKFLCHHFPTTPFVIGGEINGRFTNQYSAYLWACLERYPRRDEQPKVLEKMTDTLTVGTRNWMSAHGFGSYLSPEKIVSFNLFVKQSFLDHLVREVAIRESYGGYVRQSIADFLDRYDLEEDELSLETAIRYYTRKRPKNVKLTPRKLRASAGKIIPMPVVPDFAQVA